VDGLSVDGVAGKRSVDSGGWHKSNEQQETLEIKGFSPHPMTRLTLGWQRSGHCKLCRDNAVEFGKTTKGTEAEFMQRTDSRSQSLVVSSTDLAVVPQSHRSAAVWWKLLLAVVLAFSCGRVSAADPDNILLDFTATWCGPCQQMSSIVSKLERQHLPVRKVDVDREPALASKYNVTSIPCFVLVANGKELDRVSGITTEQQLRKMISRLPKDLPVADVTPAQRNNSKAGGLGLPVALSPTSKESHQTPFSAIDIVGKTKEQPEIGDAIFRGQPPEQDALRSSVRIRVKDGSAINYGSGTIIESQPGQAIILSCGHIFRKLSNNAVIEIDLYTNPKSAKPETVAGRVLLTDMDADVGLVSINYSRRLSSMPLGISAGALAAGDALFSIGCSSGDNPSRENVELTRINKYRGPENLECTIRPIKGRSGGGLFRDDELVGVCIAADPDQPRGLYTGLQPILQLVEKAGFPHLLPRSRTQPDNAPIAALDELKRATPETMIPASAFASTDDDAIGQMLADQLSKLERGGVSGGAANQVPEEFAGAEVLCVVRSKVPGKPDRVIIVKQASDRFLGDLLQGTDPDHGRRVAADHPSKRTTGIPGGRAPIETSAEFQQYQRDLK
jgi:thiol-disulfide isomerase/thioredoxin